MIPWMLPLGTANEMWSFAWTGPNHLSIPLSSRAGGASDDGAGGAVSEVVTRRTVAYADASLALNPVGGCGLSCPGSRSL